jgi:hypothetical protein
VPCPPGGRSSERKWTTFGWLAFAVGTAYRCQDVRKFRCPALPAEAVGVRPGQHLIVRPAWYVAGDRDLVLSFPGRTELLADMNAVVPQLRQSIILPAAAGHCCGPSNSNRRRGSPGRTGGQGVAQAQGHGSRYWYLL